MSAHGAWRTSIGELAALPNVQYEAGGLAMLLRFPSFMSRPPASSTVLGRRTWRPEIEPCIEAFGAERCMFESNFPVDRGSCVSGVMERPEDRRRRLFGR